MNLLNTFQNPFSAARGILYLHSGSSSQAARRTELMARIFPHQRLIVGKRPADRLHSGSLRVQVAGLDLTEPGRDPETAAFHRILRDQPVDVILIQGDDTAWSYNVVNLLPLLGDYGRSQQIFHVNDRFDLTPLNELVTIWRDPIHLRDADFHIECPGLIIGGELALLHRLARQPLPAADVVEIGRYYGRSTLALGHAVKQSGKGEVVTIDPWRQEDLVHTLSRHGVAGQVNVWTATSMEAYDRWRAERPDREIGLLFIDGDHRYEAVYKDIELWSRLLAPGGWIALHDYIECQHECMLAINELIVWSKKFSDVQVKASLLVARKN